MITNRLYLFEIWNLLSGIYLIFGICYLEFIRLLLGINLSFMESK
jgi:hypothetical protein